MTYLNRFIDAGLVYRSNKYDFLLLKDLVEFARLDDLNVKIRSLRAELENNGWKNRKASVSTTEGYQSKDIWYTDSRLEKTRPIPVEAKPRKNLEETEIEEAERLISELFLKAEELKGIPETLFTKEELIFSNKGLKTALKRLNAKGSLSKLSSIIRKKSSNILMGEHFFGTSSRTVLFKNYYKLVRR